MGGVFWGGDCTIMYNKILEDTQNGSGAELFLKNLEFVAQNRHYARQAGGRGGDGGAHFLQVIIQSKLIF